MRAPFIAPLGSRDGTLTRDPLTVNGLVEVRGKQVTTLRRPGLLEAYDLVAGQAQGTTYWKGTLFAARGNELAQGPTELPVADGSLWVADNDIGITPALDNDASWWWRVAKLGTSVFLVQAGNPPKTWSSTDGVNFSAWSPTGLPNSSQSQIAFFSHKTYLYYSVIQNGGVATALYQSTDSGASFAVKTASMGFNGTYGTATFVSDGTTIYAINVNQTAAIWKSINDGAAWTLVTSTPGWTAASAQGAAVYYGNKLWYLHPISREVWSSSDSGATWTKETSGAQWSGGLPVAAFVYNNRMWAFIAYGSTAGYVEVYQSIAGATWTIAHSGLSFTSEYAGANFAGAFSYGDTMYAYGNRRIGSFDIVPKMEVATVTDAGGDLYSLGTGELRLDFTSTGAAAATDYLFLKTTEKAWVLTFGSPGTLTEVTDADFPDNTVPGVVSLDGYIFVMTIDGIIYNSDLEAPLAWNALNFITAESEPDQGVAIAKHQNYVVALKERTIELFYDAGNATGSPLAAMANSVYNVGCANGYTTARCDGGLFFLSKTNSQNVSLHYFAPNALTPEELADEAFQRVLSSVDLTDAKAWAGKVAGHVLYVLVLPVEGLTLVYDLTSKLAGKLTLLTAVTAGTPSGITQVDGLATVTWTAHGCSDGDPVAFSGANQAAYNGTFNVNYVDADHVTFEVAADTVTPATGTLAAVRYTEGYFPFTALVAFNDKNYIQHETNGKLYEFSLDHLTDDGAPINFTVRLPKIDAKTTLLKKAAKVDVVGTQEDAELLVRWSDDDMLTVGKYRRVNLANDPARLRRCGSTRQRVFEFRYTGEPLIRLSAVEIT